MTLKQNYERIRNEIPDHVTLVAAAKTRTSDEVMEAIEAGITDIGENYVQEAEDVRNALGDVATSVRWHMIGHLQRNKVNKALSMFDVIQTVDSFRLAEAINKRAQKSIPILIEINSGEEPQKSGVMPDEAEDTIRRITQLENITIKGLMTMGPRFGAPQVARPYFRRTRELLDYIGALHISGVHMDTLSMGMSNTYKVAIEEGSNMIRPGTTLFGEREE